MAYLPARRSPRPWSTGTAGLGVASALVIALGLTLWWHVRGRSAAVVGEYATAVGQHEIVQLADGTRLTLAPASHVRLSPDYGTRTRDVMLDGEAYFVVRHDNAHPFAVHANGVVVHDVGTAFDVRSFAEDSATRIAVAEGVVAVGNLQASAGDVLTAVGGHVSLRHQASIAALTSWMQGTLVFNGVPLREAIRDISRAYGVQITVADSSLLNQRITVTLSNKPLDVALTVVSTVIGARFEHGAHGVVIRQRTAFSPSADHGSQVLTTARVERTQP